MVTEFRTEDVPAGDRFEYWCSTTQDNLLPNTLRSEHSADFQAGLRLLDLGPLQISALRYPPLETLRPAVLIRRSDPEWLQLTLNLHGAHRLVQGGKETTGSAGELMLYDTSRPWQGWAHAASGAVESVMVQFPRALLPLPPNRLRDLTPVLFSGQDGFGALLAGYLTRIIADPGPFTAADRPRLTGIFLDMLTALCARRLDAERVAPPESLHHALFLSIRAFIDQHLGDPGLTPTTVAAACRVSTRHLHRLFQHNGFTVAGYIRRCRLDRIRRDLADPAHDHRTVHAVAARWGLTDPAHFSRVFRTAFGVPPRDYRHHARRNTHGTQRQRHGTDRQGRPPEQI